MTAQRMHGVTAKEFTRGARPISDIAANIIGIVATAEDADAATFPTGKPVYGNSAASLLEKAGTKGTLAKTLTAITDQGDAQIVVVRAETAASGRSDTQNAEQKTAVIEACKTLAKAQAHTGFKPKILGAPELDDADVTAALAVAANALDGFVYASAGGAEDITTLKQYRAGFGQKNLMLIDNEFIAYQKGEAATAATIGRILGARAMLDTAAGPHKSISNAEIQGVSALKYPRSFGLLDINSEANTINNADITTLIRENGFRVWGNRTCSADPVWAFEPTVRVASIIKETIAQSFLWAMDKPMHPSLMIDIINGINAKLAEKVYQGWLLGAQVFIDPRKVEKSRVGNGIFAFDYEFTVAPPLENIELNQYVSDRFIVNLTDRVIEFASNLKPTTV